MLYPDKNKLAVMNERRYVPATPARGSGVGEIAALVCFDPDTVDWKQTFGSYHRGNET